VARVVTGDYSDKMKAVGVPGREPDLRETDTDRLLRSMADRYPLRVGEPRDAAVYRTSPIRKAAGTASELLDADPDESGRLR
jgi:hypothetical protein